MASLSRKRLAYNLLDLVISLQRVIKTIALVIMLVGLVETAVSKSLNRRVERR